VKFCADRHGHLEGLVGQLDLDLEDVCTVSTHTLHAIGELYILSGSWPFAPSSSVASTSVASCSLLGVVATSAEPLMLAIVIRDIWQAWSEISRIFESRVGELTRLGGVIAGSSHICGEAGGHSYNSSTSSCKRKERVGLVKRMREKSPLMYNGAR
jgi:hypothetical protein